MGMATPRGNASRASERVAAEGGANVGSAVRQATERRIARNMPGVYLAAEWSFDVAG